MELTILLNRKIQPKFLTEVTYHCLKSLLLPIKMVKRLLFFARKSANITKFERNLALISLVFKTSCFLICQIYSQISSVIVADFRLLLAHNVTSSSNLPPAKKPHYKHDNK